MSAASCNRQSKIYNLKLIPDGVLAQLVERLNGIEEVTGSNPVGSTFPPGSLAVGRGNNPVTFRIWLARRSAAISLI
jgi:hypothetical protein